MAADPGYLNRRGTYMHMGVIDDLIESIPLPRKNEVANCLNSVSRAWNMILTQMFPVEDWYSVGLHTCRLTEHVRNLAILSVTNKDDDFLFFLVLSGIDPENCTRATWVSLENMLRLHFHVNVYNTVSDDVILAIAIGKQVKFYRWVCGMMDMVGFSMNLDGEPFNIEDQCYLVSEALVNIRGVSWQQHMEDFMMEYEVKSEHSEDEEDKSEDIEDDEAKSEDSEQDELGLIG